MAFSGQIDYLQLLFLLASCIALWLLYGVIYNLFLSPYAKFPGPRLAALTSWYEFYWDGVHNGQYYFRIEEMHKRYGPYSLTILRQR
jgi:hypothetical protein